MNSFTPIWWLISTFPQRCSDFPEKLRTEIVRVLASLPESHPARDAYDDGATTASLLRLLKDEPGSYDAVLKAILGWHERVMQKQRTRDPADRG